MSLNDVKFNTRLFANHAVFRIRKINAKKSSIKQPSFQCVFNSSFRELCEELNSFNSPLFSKKKHV
jgi:hypothetical protein